MSSIRKYTSARRHKKSKWSGIPGRPEAVMEFIVRYKSENDGHTPTMREIGDACSIASTSNVNYVISVLDSRGLLYINDNGRLCVTGGRWQMETAESVISSPLPGTALVKIGSEPSRIVPFELLAQGLEK